MIFLFMLHTFRLKRKPEVHKYYWLNNTDLAAGTDRGESECLFFLLNTFSAQNNFACS